MKLLHLPVGRIERYPRFYEGDEMGNRWRLLCFSDYHVYIITMLLTLIFVIKFWLAEQMAFNLNT